MLIKTNLLSAAIVAAALGAHPPARAVSEWANPVAVCNAALQVYDADVRYRPLAVQNEGDSGAFVSCGNTAADVVTGDAYNAHRITNVGVWLRNTGAGTVDATCTFVDGTVDSMAIYTPKTIQLGSGTGGWIFWTAPVGQPYTPYANISCHLPPNVGMGRLSFDYPGLP